MGTLSSSDIMDEKKYVDSTRSVFILTRDNDLIQECVALMVKFPALEAVRGGIWKDPVSILSKGTLFMVLT